MSGSESGRRAAQRPRHRYPRPEPQHGEHAFDGHFSDTPSAVLLLDPARRLQTTLRHNQHSNQQSSGMYHAPNPNSVHTSTSGHHEDYEINNPSNTHYPFQHANDLLSCVGVGMSDPAQGLPGHIVNRSAYPGNVRPTNSPPAYHDLDLDDISHSQVSRLSERTPAQPPTSFGMPPNPVYMYPRVARPPIPSPNHSDFNHTGTPNYQDPHSTTSMPAQWPAASGMPPNHFSRVAAESRPTLDYARVDMDAFLYHERRRRAAAARRQNRN